MERDPRLIERILFILKKEQSVELTELHCTIPDYSYEEINYHLFEIMERQDKTVSLFPTIAITLKEREEG